MKKFNLVLAVLVFVMALVPTGVVEAKRPFRATIFYDFRGADDPPEFDSEGRLLVWEGTISGPDIGGTRTIKWWGVPSTPTTGQVFHFIERWEILDGEDLLLAGDDKGTTTARHGKNTIWRTNGIVTDADEAFEIWIGRHVHMGGDVTWEAPGTPDFGNGIFRIN